MTDEEWIKQIVTLVQKVKDGPIAGIDTTIIAAVIIDRRLKVIAAELSEITKVLYEIRGE